MDTPLRLDLAFQPVLVERGPHDPLHGAQPHLAVVDAPGRAAVNRRIVHHPRPAAGLGRVRLAAPLRPEGLALPGQLPGTHTLMNCRLALDALGLQAQPRHPGGLLCQL